MSALTDALTRAEPAAPTGDPARHPAVAGPGERGSGRRWVVGGIAAVLVLTAGHLLLGAFMRVPIIHPDELGYLDNARYLAHGGLRPETEYYPGFSLLLIPLWLASKDPLTVWRGALAVNAALAGVGGFVTWLLCGRLAPDLSRSWRLAVTALVSLYPAFLLYSNLALAECLFVLLFGVVVLIAGRALSGGGPGSWAALGITSGALSLVHPRGFAVVIAVVVMAVLVLRLRAADLRAALGLACGLTLSLACTRILVSATRGPTLNGFAAYHPDSILSKSLSAHGALSLLWEAGGQLFYLSAATLGLVPLGLFLALRSLGAVAKGGRVRADLMRGFAGLAFLGVWAISSLFMNLGDRPDKLMYGRYNEGAIVPLLIIALAEVLARRPDRRFAGRWHAARRWMLVGGIATGVTAASLRFGHTAGALHAAGLNPINVLGLEPVIRRSGGSIAVGAIAAVAVGALVVLAFAAWRLPVLAALLIAGLFVASAVDSEVSYLVPGSRGRADQTVIAHTLVLAGARFDLARGCIGYDPTPDTQDFTYFALRFALPGRRFRWFDAAAGQQPCGALVVSGRPDFGARLAASGGSQAPGPRLVTVEDYVGQGLWVMPGPLQDQMGAAGWLLPVPTPGPLPESARHALLRAPAAEGGLPAVGPGATRHLRLQVTHDGGGSPWPAQAGLKQARFSVAIAVRWYQAGEAPKDPGDAGHPVAVGEVHIPRTILPGETTSLTIPLVARSDGHGALAAGPLPPGRYEIRLNAMQDEGPGFTDPGLVIPVTVGP